MRSAVSSPFCARCEQRARRIERDLPHHGVDHVLDLAGEQGLALPAFVVSDSSRLKVSISPNTLAVSASVSGVGAISAPSGRQHLMHAMAEFMRQRHHVARLALVVHQHVRVRRRRGRMRERAGRLARPHRRVDPAIGEETLGDIGHFGREAAIGRQHHLLRLGPGDGAGRRERQRRVAVPMRELLLFEPAGFQLVIAVRQLWIGRAQRSDQRIHHLALDAVVEMAGIRDVLEAAPAIGNFLSLASVSVISAKVAHCP